MTFYFLIILFFWFDIFSVWKDLKSHYYALLSDRAMLGLSHAFNCQCQATYIHKQSTPLDPGYLKQ